MSLELKYTNGSEFIPFPYAPKELIMDLDIALNFGNIEDVQVNCYTCRQPIPAGTGSYCQTHMVK